MCPQGYANVGGICQANATAGNAPATAAQILYPIQVLVLTTTAANIPGGSLTVAAAGTYLVTAAFDLGCVGAGDVGQPLIGGLAVAGTQQTEVAIFVPQTASLRALITQQWLVTVPAGTVLQLIGYKSAGTGTSQIYGGAVTTMISAIRVA
jgi:hypothetical protein